ncbi:MAG: TIR domain-containing protein [Caulobacterales bacterium]|nr:TIR domain-containing protein [Caulobacterales bacterium]
MSNGYLLVAEADREAAYALGDGFDLDVIGATTIGDHDATAAALTGASNVGLILSNAAARDASFVALLRTLAQRVGVAQLIVVEAEARAAFGFLPEAWPVMPFDTALERATELVRRRQASAGVSEPPHAAPLPPTPPVADEAPPAPVDETPSAQEPEQTLPEPEAPRSEAVIEPTPSEEAPASVDEPPEEQFQTEEPPAQEYERRITLPKDAAEVPIDEGATLDEDPSLLGGVETEEESEPEISDSFGGGAIVGAPAPAPPPAEVEPPAPPPMEATPEAPPAPAMPAPRAPSSAVEPRDEEPPAPRKKEAARYTPPPAETAPADATAFAPKKVRRGTPELVRVAIHQPKDLKAVIKAARQIDPGATPAPQGMSIGDIAIGAHVGVSLEVRGAACDGAVQRRIWRGDPIDFNFSIEADSDVKQIVVLARVFVDDAQIGVLAFTRPVIGADKKAQGDGEKIRLKRHKRVFLSYSSKDRETVSAIATAYASAGVEHFWDRASLKSGEEWSPRLRKEIERADLFHLCWSKSAATSEWVEKEASYALTRRRRAKKPEITVQMLDGPPWAKHPDSLDSINFDDFVRAAIIGYARGDGET